MPQILKRESRVNCSHTHSQWCFKSLFHVQLEPNSQRESPKSTIKSTPLYRRIKAYSAFPQIFPIYTLEARIGETSVYHTSCDACHNWEYGSIELKRVIYFQSSWENLFGSSIKYLKQFISKTEFLRRAQEPYYSTWTQLNKSSTVRGQWYLYKGSWLCEHTVRERELNSKP